MLVCDILEKGFGIMPDGQAESQKIDFKIIKKDDKKSNWQTAGPIECQSHSPRNGEAISKSRKNS